MPSDQRLAINDPANETFAGLPFRAQSGGFLVQVRQISSGATQSVRVNIDLDGVTSAGLAGINDDTTPEQIRAALDAVGGIRATFTPEGRLKVEAETGYDFSFADDTSNVLAVLGVNSYFTGTDASNLQVRADLVADPTKLVTGRMSNGQFIENGTVLAIAQLQDRPLASLSNQSILGSWRDTVQAIGVVTSAAQVDAQAAGVIRDSLDAQRAAMSGVSVDEEAINLSNYQRAYQGAARLVQVTDELTQTLMSLI
jgi:flagellar hook-associated protein 1 FlgK